MASAEAIAKIRQLTTAKKQAEQIQPQAIENELCFIKLDLQIFQDDDNDISGVININARYDSQLREHYEDKENNPAFFKRKAAGIKQTNEYNNPSNFDTTWKDLVGDYKEHSFYSKFMAKRDEVMKQYRNKNMFIRPYVKNLYKPHDKNEGLENFMVVMVWQEDIATEPEVYLQWGDYTLQTFLPFYKEGQTRGKDYILYSFKKKLREYEPSNRRPVGVV